MDLFGHRARAVHPAYVTDPSNAAAVRTVCRRLDGIPLAIELAAAWVGMFTPAQISLRSTTGSACSWPGRAAVSPAASLAASVVWSHDLLPDDARCLSAPSGSLLGRLHAAGSGVCMCGGSAGR